MGAQGNLKLDKKIETSFFSDLVLFILLLVPSNAKDLIRVTRVVDGDTLLLVNGEYVRLIGVDTPETKHQKKPVEYFGKEAYRFTKKMVEGKEVRLEYDQIWRF